MTVEYDLVVIGGTPAGVYAAMMAARLKARVALIDQGNAPATAGGYANRHVLGDLEQMLQQVGRLGQRGVGPFNDLPTVQPGQVWQQMGRWAEAIAAKLDVAQSPDALSQLGIEVITGCGEFYRKPTPGFAVNGRRLRSRAYLLAIAYQPVIPEISGLQTSDYLTVDTVLKHSNWLQECNSLVVLGDDPVGVEMAQTLSRLGLPIVLAVSQPRILPFEDPELAYLLQAQLETEGIQVVTDASITQIRQIDGKTWVQVGNQAIETNKVLLAMGWQPDIANLNLEAVGVTVTATGIVCNQKLQTTNPRIYTCTTPGDYLQPHLDRQRVKVAVNNALFFPISKFTRRTVPHVVYTAPQLARVGMGEAAAFEAYGKDGLIVRSPLKALPKAWITGASMGLAKFIVHRNGTILGAHILAPQASEIIGIVTLAMQRHLKIGALVDLALPSPSFAELIHATAQEWHHLRLQQNPRLQDLLEWCFDVRRSWH